MKNIRSNTSLSRDYTKQDLERIASTMNSQKKSAKKRRRSESVDNTGRKAKSISKTRMRTSNSRS